ncbi:MAG TPA: hypothetical protein PK580_00085 [Nitrosomonas halophila]|nr:hypothetical protein [Nitrosomonas halophila]
MRKIIFSVALMLVSFSVVASNEMWHSFAYHHPEARECEPLRDLFSEDAAFHRTIPDGITPEDVVEIIKRNFGEYIPIANIVRDKNSVPVVVFAAEAGGDNEGYPPMTFMVFKGRDTCEKDRAIAISAKAAAAAEVAKATKRGGTLVTFAEGMSKEYAQKNIKGIECRDFLCFGPKGDEMSEKVVDNIACDKHLPAEIMFDEGGMIGFACSVDKAFSWLMIEQHRDFLGRPSVNYRHSSIAGVFGTILSWRHKGYYVEFQVWPDGTETGFVSFRTYRLERY